MYPGWDRERVDARIEALWRRRKKRRSADVRAYLLREIDMLLDERHLRWPARDAA
jgi:hypothetical protein